VPDVQAVAVRVTFSGLQMVVFDAVITGAFTSHPPPQSAFVLIITGADTALVPHVFLHTAVYVPATVTVNELPVAFVLQVTVPEQPVAVNIADSVEHISALSEVKIGAEGVPPEVIVTVADAGLVPQSFLHTAL
jgi:hypothetical protein